MSGGYVVYDPSEFGELRSQLRDIRDRLSELEAPTGTQTAEALGKIRLLVEDLAAEVAALAASGVTWAGPVSTAGSVAAASVSATGAVTAASVAATGAMTAASLTATADVTATGTVNGVAGIQSIDAYNRVLTTSYRALWVTNTGGTGQFGYVPSSERFKQEIESAEVPAEVWRALRLVTFRYIAAVAAEGEQAGTEWGLIAEEVDALGLTWLVDYDEEGQPFGVKREQLALVLISAVQDVDRRLTDVDERLATLEAQLS